jgi:hypothetical protein
MLDEQRERHIQVATTYAETLVVGLHLTWPVRWLRRGLGLVERQGYRMPLRASEMERAVVAGPSLASFHPWVRVDRHDYRVEPSRILLECARKRLRDLDADIARRTKAVERLRALPMVAAGVRKGTRQPSFCVPLLVKDRAALIANLERRILNIGYIYAPALDDYACPPLPSRVPTPMSRAGGPVTSSQSIRSRPTR